MDHKSQDGVTPRSTESIARNRAMQFRVLGPLELIDVDRLTPLGPTREGALLAILLIHAGEVVSTGRLIEDLWGGQAPAQASTTLASYIRDLRRLLEPDRRAGSASEVLVTRRPGYLLRVGPDCLDAWQFERLADEGRRALESTQPGMAAEALQTALGLWRGTPFGALSTESFALPEVTRLEEQRLSVLEVRVEADIALGRHCEVVAELEALVAEHPYRERLWEHLLLALYRSGRQAEALRAYACLRRRLAEELGIEPCRSLQMLEQAILLQKPELDRVAPGERARLLAVDPEDSRLVPGPASAEQDSHPHQKTCVTEVAATKELLSFLSTDIEGSAALWEDQPGPMATAMTRHREIVDHVVTSSGGLLVKHRGEGDSALAMFKLASDAVAAAARLARAFSSEPWPAEVPLRVRSAVNTGEAEVHGGNYYGSAVNRAAGLRSLALGGEVLLGESTAALVAETLPPGTTIADIGPQELPYLRRPQHVFELRLDEADDTHGPGDNEVEPSILSWTSSPRDLVGRVTELEALERAWLRTKSGQHTLVSISGEPGIGKTRLAGEFARRVHQSGGLVLYGRWDRELLWSFQAFREALGGYGRLCSKASMRADVRGCVRDLARLLPDMVDKMGGGTPLRADPETERFRLFEAVDSWLTNVASRQPVLLVLDDLHWADKPSLLLLQHLMRMTNSRLLLLATYCPAEVHQGDEVSGTLEGFRRTSGFKPIDLRGLAEHEVHGVLTNIMGDALGGRGADLARLLWRETSGNPFFLTEIVRYLADSGAIDSEDERFDTIAGVDPVDVHVCIREVVQARIARLSENCRQVLSAAAVSGEHFESLIIGPASDTGDEGLVEALDEALRAGVVIEVSGPDDHYAFAHNVVRHTLYDGLSHARRTYLHHRVALALEDRYGAEGSHLAAVAYHFWAGEFWARSTPKAAERAVHYARLAGEKAVHEVAYEDAVAHYRRGLEVIDRHGLTDQVERCKMHLALGDAYNRAGEVAAGGERFLEAARIARALDSPELLTEAALGFGGILPGSVAPDPRAKELLEEALRALGEEDSPARALVLARLAHWLHHTTSRE